MWPGCRHDACKKEPRFLVEWETDGRPQSRLFCDRHLNDPTPTWVEVFHVADLLSGEVKSYHKEIHPSRLRRPAQESAPEKSTKAQSA